MLTIQEIKEKIEQGLSGAQVEIQDPRQDGIHLKAIVTWAGFKDQSLVEQHRLVYETLKEELKEELHALALETKLPMTQTKTVEDQIREMVTTNKVFLFMKGTPQEPQCGFSQQSVAVLSQLNAKFGTFDVLSNEEIRQGIKDYANWPTIPQLYIEGKFIGGCDIMRQMSESGELQKLLS